MLDKWEAVGRLTEQRLPLYTSEIRQTLRDTHEGIKAPAPVFSAILELVKRHSDHFADLIYKKTKRHSIRGECVWTNPDTENYFHDVDIKAVFKYITVCLYMERRFWRLPHEGFVKAYTALYQKKSAERIVQGMRRDQQMFFSHPPALMDDTRWDNWLRLARWTEEEAVALSLGKDPDVVSSQSMQKQNQSIDLPSPFQDEYQLRIRQLK